MKALVTSHSKLLEISELYLQKVKPSSLLGLEVSKNSFRSKTNKKFRSSNYGIIIIIIHKFLQL